MDTSVRPIIIMTFRIPSKVVRAVIEMGDRNDDAVAPAVGKALYPPCFPTDLGGKVDFLPLLNPPLQRKNQLVIHLPFPQNIEQIIPAKIIVCG